MVGKNQNRAEEETQENGSSPPQVYTPGQGEDWPEFQPFDSNLPTINSLSSPQTIDEQREEARGWIAKWLIYILAFIVVASFFTLWVDMFFDKDMAGSLGDVMTLVFAPVVGLVGAVTGFYYGEKIANKSNNEGGS